ncbi:MAG TPA: SemiSWEET transporter [bacterium]|jgi:MtN3 and saliva related transmembrane protein|nr:SemiSWEET transporter [bacterium]MDX9804915.1 SemiSWEET transporter [bacterium]HNW15229.1 SemiSWEET transporter [bacterium]HNZ52558.1 SemiSWEET transporter [bacterium]HOB70447.1 SemiSWEET transporter [bacterium]
MSIVSLIGIAAAICTTVSFVPQVLKTIKTGQTKDISLSMYLIFTTGIVLWLIYGIMIRDLPIILANTVTVVLTSIVVVLKIRNG